VPDPVYPAQFAMGVRLSRHGWPSSVMAGLDPAIYPQSAPRVSAIGAWWTVRRWPGQARPWRVRSNRGPV